MTIERPGMTGLQDALRAHGISESQAWNLGGFIDMLNDGASLDELLNGEDGPQMHELYRTLRLLLGEQDPGEYDGDYKPDEAEEAADSPVTQEEDEEGEEEPAPLPDDLIVNGADGAPVEVEEEEEEEEDEDEDEDMAEEVEEVDDSLPWA